MGITPEKGKVCFNTFPTGVTSKAYLLPGIN